MTNKKSNKKVENQVANNAAAVINAFAEGTKGLLATNMGTAKSSIYKEELFEGCTEKGKKSLRKKFRNMLFSAAKAITTETDKAKLNALVTAFNQFYTEAYRVNDYSLSSVCNENLAAEKKDILTKALAIAQGK